VSDPYVRLALWLHPVLGLLATVLAVRTAALALQGRARTKRGAAALASHRVLSPWVYGLVVVGWVGGVVSVWLGRSDIDLFTTGHFQVGTLIVVLFTASWAVSLRLPAEAWARAVHPWIGAAALMALGVQVFLGLQLMPR
jgi:hypothetical protein